MFWVGAVVSMCFFQLLSANIIYFESEPSAPPISRSHPINPLNNGAHVSGLRLNKIFLVAPQNWGNSIILYEYFDGEIIQLNCTYNFGPEYWQLDDIFKDDGVNSIPERSFIFNRRMKKDYHWSTIICGYKYMKTFITFFYVEEKPTKTEQLETNRSDNNDQPGTVQDNYWIYAISAIVAIVLFLLIMTIFLLRRKQLQQRTEVAIVTDSHYENIAESSLKYENLASDKDELKYSEIDFDGHESKFGQTGINKDLKPDIEYAEVFQNRNDLNNKMEEISKECKYMNEIKVYTNIDQKSLEPIYCEVGEGNNNNRNSIVII